MKRIVIFNVGRTTGTRNGRFAGAVSSQFCANTTDGNDMRKYYINAIYEIIMNS